MRGEEENKAGVGVIGRRTIRVLPEQVAKTRGRGADVGVGVVSVDAPGLESALHDEVVARTPDMVHDFLAATFLEGFAHAAADGFENLRPGNAFPLAAAPWSNAVQGIENAVGIVNLVDGRRSLGAQASAAGGMPGIAFELVDFSALLVDVSEQAAGGFAVETDGGNQLVVLLYAPRPGFRVELDPIVPLLDGRTRGEVAAIAFEIGHQSLRAGLARLGCPSRTRSYC